MNQKLKTNKYIDLSGNRKVDLKAEKKGMGQKKNTNES